MLSEVSPRGLDGVFECLRGVLQEGQIDKRVQYMIEVLFAVRKDRFKDHPRIPEGLDLVDEEDQITHTLLLDDETLTAEEHLDVFREDPDFLVNEEKYQRIKRELLGDGESGDEASHASGTAESDASDDESGADEAGGSAPPASTTASAQQPIVDKTGSSTQEFRRTVYLTIMNSLSFDECAHKLLRMPIRPGQEPELCNMIFDCCIMERTYYPFYGQLAERFCRLQRVYEENVRAAVRPPAVQCRPLTPVLRHAVHAAICPAVRHGASIGHAQVAQRGAVLRALALHRRHSLDRVRAHPSERGRDHIEQACVAVRACGRYTRRRPPTCPRPARCC